VEVIQAIWGEKEKMRFKHKNTYFSFVVLLFSVSASKMTRISFSAAWLKPLKTFWNASSLKMNQLNERKKQ